MYSIEDCDVSVKCKICKGYLFFVCLFVCLLHVTVPGGYFTMDNLTVFPGAAQERQLPTEASCLWKFYKLCHNKRALPPSQVFARFRSGRLAVLFWRVECTLIWPSLISVFKRMLFAFLITADISRHQSTSAIVGFDGFVRKSPSLSLCC